MSGTVAFIVVLVGLRSFLTFSTLYSKQIQTKTVQDVIEFYYDWKKTSHYKQWKKNYLPDERDVPTVIGD